jgi:hypothetical protein
METTLSLVHCETHCQKRFQTASLNRHTLTKNGFVRHGKHSLTLCGPSNHCRLVFPFRFADAAQPTDLEERVNQCLSCVHRAVLCRSSFLQVQFCTKSLTQMLKIDLELISGLHLQLGEVNWSRMVLCRPLQKFLIRRSSHINRS